MANVKESVNVSIFTALKVSEVAKVPLFLLSNPGLGKTTTVEMFAKIRGYRLQLLRGNSTTAEEILGYDVVDAASPESKAAKHLRPSWFEEVLTAKNDKGERVPTLLFLDELTTAHETVQSALLHLVLDRAVGSEKLPEDTLVVAAGNYAQNLSNQTGALLPPVLNRFILFNITPKVEDLDVFLCRYKGAIVSPDGTPIDYMANLAKTLEEMDSKALDLDPSTVSRIGEHFENAIYAASKLLWVQKHKLDPTIKDLQGLYSDATDDDKLLGFYTYRSAGFLVKVTLASFLCFGKYGIESDTFRNMIDGLVGLGLTKSAKKNAPLERHVLTQDFYSTIVSVLPEVEKLCRKGLVEYETAVTNILNTGASVVAEVNSAGEEVKILSHQVIHALTNKLQEMTRDRSLADVSKPLPTELVTAIYGELAKAAAYVVPEMSGIILGATPKDNRANFKVEDLINFTNNWNNLATALNSLNILVAKSSGYGQAVPAARAGCKLKIRHAMFKISTYKKHLNEFATASSEVESQLVPNLIDVPGLLD